LFLFKGRIRKCQLPFPGGGFWAVLGAVLKSGAWFNRVYVPVAVPVLLWGGSSRVGRWGRAKV